jgi:tetratricopeptide (TPR) repeat protein
MTDKRMADLLIPAAYTEKDAHLVAAGWGDISRLSSGKRKITEKHLAPYLQDGALNRTRAHFDKYIMKLIPEASRSDLKRKLCKLIDIDATIDDTDKKRFAEAAAKKPLHIFLADVFYHAISRENTATAFNNSMFEQNKFFVGREEQLKQIRSRFRNGKTVIVKQTISGLGGVGKTQLARKYAFERIQEYDVIWWINAESSETVFASVRPFLERKKLLDVNGKDPATALAIFAEWFEKNEDWLLIFDNAEKYDCILPAIPKSGRGSILLTTRLSQGEWLGEILQLSVFSEAEAVDFLRRRTGLEDKDRADELAWQLGGLPLALEQAGAYIVENELKSYVTYIDLLKKDGLTIFDENENITDYEQPLKKTMRISLREIKHEAKLLLQMIAYFMPDDIPLSIFYDNAEALPEPLKSDFQRQSRANRILRDLTRYSLVKRDDDSLSIHRLVQAVVLEDIGEDTVPIESCLRLYSHICGLERQGSYKAFDSIVPNINRTLNIAKDKSPLLSRETVEWFHMIYAVLAKFYFNLGAYKQAIALYSLFIDRCEHIDLTKIDISREEDIYISAYINASLIYSLTGEQYLAKHTISRGIKFMRRYFGADEYNISTMYNMASQVYEFCGDYAEALEWCEKSLKAEESAIKPDCIVMLWIKGNMVPLYEKIEQAEKAENLRREIHEAWALFPKESLEKDPHSYELYLTLCMKTGLYDEAIYWCDKKMHYNDEQLGLFHPETVKSMMMLGQINALKGDYQAAIWNLRPVLIYQINQLGENHEQVQSTYNQILFCIEKINNPAPA